MKAIQQKSIGGFTVPIFVYENYDEADRAAGRVNAALDECNKNLVYRGTLNDARILIADTVEKVTGVKREYDPVMGKVKGDDGVERDVQLKDKDGNERWVPKLKDEAYVEAAIAAWKQAGNTDLTPLQNAITEAAASYQYKDDNDKVIATGLQVDIKETPRKAPTPKVLAAKFVDGAKALIAAPDKLKGFLKFYAKYFGADSKPDIYAANGTTIDATKLGWAIKAAYAKREEQELGSFAA
jgi:hypothetical protein